MSDEDHTILNTLRTIPIFGGLSDSALTLLLEHAETIEVASGEYLFREGDPPTSVYILRSGQVEILKASQSGEASLGRLDDGACIGEMALIDFQSRSGSVVALAHCEFVEIPTIALRQLMQTDLQHYTMIMMNMGREVSRRLRLADQRILELQRQLEIAVASGHSDGGQKCSNVISKRPPTTR